MNDVLSTGFPARRYFFAAGCCLLLALFAGLWGIVMVAFSTSGDDISAFTYVRPLHVTFAISWILVAALAGVHAFLPRAVDAQPFSGKLAKISFWLLAVAGLISLAAYLTGHHTGREYLNFPLPAALLIFVAWICFAINFLRTAMSGARRWPVYVWMWATGLVMFAYTFIEGHLYLFEWFNAAPVRDQSVQWKSYGALTGSWNMFVYGLSMYLMERFAGAQTARSRRAFFFYWLGLTNLLFGWAHHTYMLPQSEWIRWMAFFISMTEWVILATLLWDWAQPFDRKVWREQPQHRIPRAFLASASTFERWNKKHHVDVFSFAETLTPSSVESVSLREPTGPSTLIRQALEQVRSYYDAGDLAGIVLISDGIATGGFAREGGRDGENDLSRGSSGDFLEALDTRVHTVWAGRPGLGDVAVARVLVDEFAFVRTVVRIEVEVRATGYEARRIPITLSSEGQPLREKWVTVGPGDTEESVVFELSPPRVGKFVYEVSTPVADDEAVAENNRRAFVLQVIRDKIRVLQVAGQPSWDVRALRRMLEQNPNVDLISFFILRTHDDHSMVPNSEMSLIPFRPASCSSRSCHHSTSSSCRTSTSGLTESAYILRKSAAM